MGNGHCAAARRSRGGRGRTYNRYGFCWEHGDARRARWERAHEGAVGVLAWEGENGEGVALGEAGGRHYCEQLLVSWRGNLEKMDSPSTYSCAIEKSVAFVVVPTHLKHSKYPSWKIIEQHCVTGQDWIPTFQYSKLYRSESGRTSPPRNGAKGVHPVLHAAGMTGRLRPRRRRPGMRRADCGTIPAP